MSVVAVGTQVRTTYGVGKVNEYREEGQLYSIELTEWRLSNDQRVMVFAQAQQFTVIAEKVEEAKPVVEEVALDAAVPDQIALVSAVAVEEVVVEAPKKQEFAIGTPVKTIYGQGKIVAIRDDTIIQVELTSWFLSEGQKVNVFAQASQLKFIDAPTASADGVDAGAEVQVEAEEDDTPKVVKTQYGVGKIVAYRETDKIFQIELTSWFLSDGQKVNCFLQAGQFKVIDAAGEEHEVVNVPANAKASKGEKGCCSIM